MLMAPGLLQTKYKSNNYKTIVSNNLFDMI